MRARPSFLAAAASAILALAPASGAAAAAPKRPVSTTEPSAVIADGPIVGLAGRVLVAKPVVDVGDVVRGQPANAVFEIKNNGTEILKILSAKPG